MLFEAPTEKEAKLAKSLVHPEKAMRDKTFNTIKSYAASIVEIDDLDMLKLWKALYYCMWLADKQVVQMELANELANMSDHFRNHSLRMKYFTLFFRIMLREWSFLDQYRVNKFYSLIRIVLNKMFSVAKDEHWSAESIDAVTSMLETEVLTKTPNGIRYHIADIYLQELLKVTDGVIETSVFDKLLTPFYNVLVRVDDSTFIERVSRSVFGAFAQELCAESKSSEEDSDKKVFTTVNTKFLQKKMFDLASDEQTNERFRKRLYELHKAISLKTRVQFVTDEMLQGNAVVKTATKSDKEEKKPKSKKEKRSITEEAAVEAEVVPPAKKAKAAVSEVAPPQPPKKEEQPVKAVDSAVKSTKEDKKSKKKEAVEPAAKTPVAEVVTKPVAATETPSKKKKDIVVTATETPSKKKKDVVEAAPVAETSSEEKPTYIAAKKFEGAKKGYVFKKVSYLVHFDVIQL